MRLRCVFPILGRVSEMMSGMKKVNTSAKTANDPNSRINKSLRAWDC